MNSLCESGAGEIVCKPSRGLISRCAQHGGPREENKASARRVDPPTGPTRVSPWPPIDPDNRCRCPAARLGRRRKAAPEARQRGDFRAARSCGDCDVVASRVPASEFTVRNASDLGRRAISRRPPAAGNPPAAAAACPASLMASCAANQSCTSWHTFSGAARASARSSENSCMSALVQPSLASRPPACRSRSCAAADRRAATCARRRSPRTPPSSAPAGARCAREPCSSETMIGLASPCEMNS